MTTYIELGGGGGGSSSPQFYGDPVATFASLPASGALGETRLVLDTQNFYHWTGVDWQIVNTEVATVARTSTDSISLTTPGDVLTADLNLSGDAATAGNFKATTTVKSGGSPGLHVEIPEAETAQTGVLTSTDWNTFNNKEPAISATTSADYYRGDKTFQPLNMPAIGIIESDLAPSSASVLGIVIGPYTNLTTTGVGVTGVWGNVTSVSIPAGYWMITGVLHYEDNGATLTTSVKAGFTTSPVATGIDPLEYTEIPFLSNGSGEQYRITIPTLFIGFNSATTVYLNTNFTYFGGTPRHGGQFRAVRLK